MIHWIIRHYLNLTTWGRASGWLWRRARRRFLKDTDPLCACCGYAKKIEVHHIIPRHIRPDLTLVHSNLIVLCRDCHFHIGHLNSFKHYNSTIKDVAFYVLSRSDRRPDVAPSVAKFLPNKMR
jgi:hypothetical protein